MKGYTAKIEGYVKLFVKPTPPWMPKWLYRWILGRLVLVEKLPEFRIK